MIRSTLTDRWQTTIPAEVRVALGLQQRQGILYEIRGESVTLRAEGESLMDLAGCLKSTRAAASKKEARNGARQHVVDNFMGHDS
jgi:bifunctional DNA-binding transcriptional regulator/antitoxin component of YhaV-PrlF toxin-antitoxin module